MRVHERFLNRLGRGVRRARFDQGRRYGIRDRPLFVEHSLPVAVEKSFVVAVLEEPSNRRHAPCNG